MRTANGPIEPPSQRGLHYKLRSREYGKPMAMNSENMSDKLRRRLNSQFNDVIRFTKDLKSGVQAKSWTNIETSVTDLVNVLVDHLEKRDVPVASKHQMRHLFVAYGGLDALLQVLLPPITPSDARTIPKATFREKSESWNEILLLIRELIMTIPSLTDRYFSIEHISFMFTLLHHSSVFDSAVSALEEILAFREDPFPLYAVPKFFDLMKKFSSRHMAHFTRIISLTIFEPEDRQILEGTQVLRSLDLLRIRRSRTSRSSNFVVEKNQNLLVQMPDFIPRLVQVLRVVNHGPDLSEFIQRNIVAHLPISTDVMTFSATAANIDDWEHFKRLEKAIKDSEDEAANQRASNGGQGAASTASTARPAAPQPTIMRELLEAMTPSTPSGGLELGNVIRVMLLAERHEIAQISPLGQAFLFSQQIPETEHEPLLELQQRLLRARLRRGYPSSAGPITAERGRNELLFHALILAPHMIEIIFVLCTLLSGRRKVCVQNMLLQLGMDTVLSRLFERMSWDAPPFTGPNTMEHIHGPNCECNPENAVRVQVLRLIHNYYDRDFMGNSNKFALLSPGERQFFLRDPEALADAGTGLQDGEALNGVEKGLISKIIDVLMKEPTNSQYRFWLSACVENFLRGCGRRGQIFVTERGVLRSTIQNVFDVTVTGVEETSPSIHSGVNAYQTSFDLVGEIIKCNPRVLEHLEASLSDEEFRGWIRVCLDHLVDSNVFLRSLYLTVELYHMANTHPLGIRAFELFGYVENALTPASVPVPSNRLCLGYLKASWSQVVPVVSAVAIQQYLDKKEVLKQRKAKAVRSSTTGKRTVTTTASSRLTSSRSSSTTSSTSSGLSSSPAQQFLQHIVNNATASLEGLMSTLTGSSTSTPNRATMMSSSRSSLSSSSSAAAAAATTAVVGKTKAIWEDSEIPILDDGGVSPAKPDSSCGDVHGLHDGAFYTPPEGPQFARHADAVNDTRTANANDASYVSVDDLAVSVSLLAASSEATKQQEAAASLPPTQATVVARGGGGGGGGIVPTTAAAPLTVQPKIFRFTMFLAQERLSILIRLMSNVSLYTINHENICCLNTALVMLLFDLQRLQLGQVLQKVRDMAEDLEPVIPALIASRKASHRQKSGGITPMLCVHLLSDSADGSSVGGGSVCGCAVPGCVGESQPNSPFGGGFSTKSNNSTSSTGSSSGQKKKKDLPEDPVYKKNLRRRAEDQAILAYRNALAASHDGSLPTEEDEEERPWSNGDLVMMNFRELLWYWREYYLRRGRDRLSIEFSAHIAFHHFLNLVDLLCADDGSECALLPRPIALPESPYQMTNLQCLLSSRSLTRGDIIHL